MASVSTLCDAASFSFSLSTSSRLEFDHSPKDSPRDEMALPTFSTVPTRSPFLSESKPWTAYCDDSANFCTPLYVSESLSQRNCAASPNDCTFWFTPLMMASVTAAPPAPPPAPAAAPLAPAAAPDAAAAPCAACVAACALCSCCCRCAACCISPAFFAALYWSERSDCFACASARACLSAFHLALSACALAWASLAFLRYCPTCPIHEPPIIPPEPNVLPSPNKPPVGPPVSSCTLMSLSLFSSSRFSSSLMCLPLTPCSTASFNWDCSCSSACVLSAPKYCHSCSTPLCSLTTSSANRVFSSST